MEERMRSWTPRKPSTRLEQELFAAKATPGAPRAHRRLHLPWYQTLGASVAGCVVVLFTVLNFMQLGATHGISSPFGPLSNHLASMAMVSAPINTVSAPILSWTNDGTVGSSTRPYLLNTNTILP